MSILVFPFVFERGNILSAPLQEFKLLSDISYLICYFEGPSLVCFLKPYCCKISGN